MARPRPSALDSSKILASPATPVTRVYAQEWFSRRFARDPNYTINL